MKAIFAILSICLLSQADILTIQDLKKDFVPFEATYQKAWERAEKMKYKQVKVSGEIKKKDCLDYQAKIEKEYKLSPFTLKFLGGTSTFGFCEGSNYYSPERFYFQDVKMENQFGLPIAHVLQTRNRPGFTITGILTLYLDETFRIVEVASTASNDRDAEVNVFEITLISMDKNGDRYVNVYQPVRQKNVYAKQMYSPSDGSSTAVTRILRPRRADKGNAIIELRIIDRATKPDWDAYDILPTYSIDGGYYTYGKDLRPRPANYNRLVTYWVGKNNVCSDGEMWEGHHVLRTFAPTAAEAEMGYCGNTW